MTVRELIDRLQNHDPDMEVYIEGAEGTDAVIGISFRPNAMTKTHQKIVYRPTLARVNGEDMMVEVPATEYSYEDVPGVVLW